MHKCGLCRHAVSVCLSSCLFVWLSVTFVDSVKTNNRILRLFSSSGRQTIHVFAHQTLWRYSDGNPLHGGVERRWDMQKSRLWANIWFYRVLWAIRAASAIHLATTNHGKLMTIVADKQQRYVDGGRRRRSVCDKKPRCYAVDNRAAFKYAVVNLKPK